MSIHNLGNIALSAAIALGLTGFAAAQQMPANPVENQGNDAGHGQVNATGAVSGQAGATAAPQAAGGTNDATGQTSVTDDESGGTNGANDGMTDDHANPANDAAGQATGMTGDASQAADDGSGQQANPPNPPNPPSASGQTGTMNPPAGTTGENPPAGTTGTNPPAATGSENPPAGTPGAASQPSRAQAPMMRKRTVTIVQRQLRSQGLYRGRIDGVQGPQTRVAIIRFQRLHRLPATGNLNAATMRQLAIVRSAGESGEASRAMEPGAGMTMHSTQVIQRVQRELRGEGLYRGPIDGVDGPATHTAIRRFQRQENIPVTGSLNRTTLHELHIFRTPR